MDRAKSLRRDAVLTAEAITYEDCIADDIVCAACGNRVYKAVRGKGAAVVHYLSHYQAQSDEARKCEERQASGNGTGNLYAAFSKGQALSVRLKAISRVLALIDPEASADAALIAEACTTDGPLPGATPTSMLRSACTTAFRLIASYRGHPTDLAGSANASDVPGLLRSLKEAAIWMPSPPEAHRWPRWTGELVSLIVLAESAPALDGLFSHAAARLMRANPSSPDRIPQTLRSIVEGRVIERESAATANELRAVLVRGMWTTLEELDPAIPVPRTYDTFEP